MKKTYMIPEVSVVGTELESMIAESGRFDNSITVGKGSELSREEMLWDEEDW